MFGFWSDGEDDGVSVLGNGETGLWTCCSTRFEEESMLTGSWVDIGTEESVVVVTVRVFVVSSGVDGGDRGVIISRTIIGREKSSVMISLACKGVGNGVEGCCLSSPGN